MSENPPDPWGDDPRADRFRMILTFERMHWMHVHNALCCACMALVWALSTPQSAVTFGLIFLSVGSLPVLAAALISWLRRRR